MTPVKSLFFACVIGFAVVASATDNISVVINGTTYTCSGSNDQCACSGTFSGVCNGQSINTNGVVGAYALLVGTECVAFVQGTTDYDGLVKCNAMKKQACE